MRLREAAAKAAGSTPSALLTMIGVAALAAGACWVVPAEAKKKTATKQVEEAIPDPANGEPMTLIVSLNNQRVDIYRGTTFVTSSKVSTGMRGYSTKAGVFSILEKKRYHHSNLYSGAPMPWMQRLTWSGTALHAGVVPGYPASHGCIRLPFSFAPKLFGITTVGEHVVVARDSVAPQLIEHEALFQPLPPPSASNLVKQDHPPQRQSDLEPLSIQPAATALPIVLAKADAGSVTIDRAPANAAAALSATPAERSAAAASSQAKSAAVVPGEPAPNSESVDTQIDDTRVHAIDPFAAGENEAPTVKHALYEIGDEPDPVDTTADALTTIANTVKKLVVPASAEDGQVSNATAASEPDIAAKLEVEAVARAAGTAAALAEATPQLTLPASEAPEAAQNPLTASDPQPEGALSVSAAKLTAGAKAAAIQAAEPRSTAPLRILVTRRTQRDRIIGVQKILAEMGYLPALDFDGTLGKPSITAIKEFQKANGMPETGAFNDELVKKVYEVAGKEEPPVGHLFVRQEFTRLFDSPVSFRDPDKPLGTHLFTALKFEPGDTKARWIAVSLQGDDPAAVLDRLEIPTDLRQKISERLTPGSSLIVGDTAINSASLPKGADFLVWATDPAKAGTKVANTEPNDGAAQPRRKKKRVVRRTTPVYGFGPGPRTFSRGYSPWPW